MKQGGMISDLADLDNVTVGTPFKLANTYYDLYYFVIYANNDTMIQCGSFDLPSIPARTGKDITVPYTLEGIQAKPGAEYYLNISYQLKAAASYAPAGHELATAQFKLPVYREGIEVILEGALKVTKGHTTLRAEGAYMTFQLTRQL